MLRREEWTKRCYHSSITANLTWSKRLSGHDDGNCVFKKIDFFDNEEDDEEMEDILPSSESDDEDP